jgi:uncharacterized protein
MFAASQARKSFGLQYLLDVQGVFVMTSEAFSVILIPTLNCNAACDYCFENKVHGILQLNDFESIVHKLLDHLDKISIAQLTFYWQGGEVLTLKQEWFLRANDIMKRAEARTGKKIVNRIQSNLIAYHPKWNEVLKEVFDNDVGSSLDFPNLHRRIRGGTAHSFNQTWRERLREAQENGIRVGVIAVANQGTLSLGAEAFYSYYVEDIGLKNLQINTPFAGGTNNAIKAKLPLDTSRLAVFLTDLAQLWIERGYGRGISIGPFDRLLDYFMHGDRSGLPCIWIENCANHILCVDPMGNVAQCDSWVSSYPDFRYGNILQARDVAEVLNSEQRQLFQARPIELLTNSDCLDCGYLALCHGGCPIRAFSTYHNLVTKDPYCETYREIFKCMDQMAVKVSRQDFVNGIEGQPGPAFG